jgi:outer membrane protein
MRLLRILLVLIVSAVAAAAQPGTNAYPAGLPPAAPSANTRVLSLQDLIQQTLQHNLDLQIDRFNPQLAFYTLRVAYSGWDPTLNVAYKHSHDERGGQIFGPFTAPGSISASDAFDNNGSVLTGATPWGMTYDFGANLVKNQQINVGSSTNQINTTGQAAITLTQPLLKNLWIDQTRLNIRIDKNRLKYSEQQFRLNIMQTVTLLEQAYDDLIYDRENVAVQAKAVELAEELASENKRKVAVGALAILDEQQAESQAATARAQLIAAQYTLGSAERTIKSMVSQDYSSWADLEIQPSGKLTDLPQSFSRPDSWTKGLTLRPEILQAKLDLERDGIQLKYDKNQLFPELDLVGTYGYNGSGLHFGNAIVDIQQLDHATYAIGAQLSVPLGNIKARNTVKSDKLTIEQALLTVKRWERDIMEAVDDDIAKARSGFEAVLATRAAREYADQALVAEQKKLDNGKSTTFLVLQAQNTLTTARGQEIQALDVYNKALSQLSQDEGGTLDRLGIDVDVK